MIFRIVAVAAIAFGVKKLFFSRTDIQYEYGTNSWANWLKYGLPPPCAKPVVFPNAFNLNAITINNSEFLNCQNHSDLCSSFFKQRLIEFFGDRILDVYSPNTTTGANVDRTKFVKFPTLKEYLTYDEYLSYSAQGVNGLANVEEYSLFLQNNFTDLINQSSFAYLGSNIFIGRGIHSGSAMHYAFGRNVFVQLAGKKRWVTIHPSYIRTFGCEQNSHALSAHCKTHPTTLGNIDTDKQIIPLLKKYNVPNDKYLDVILNPGDVMIQCDTWPHMVENLTPFVFGFASRFFQYGGLFSLEYLTSRYLPLFDTLIQTIKSKLTDWNKFTAIDILSAVYFSERSDIFNYDPRLKTGDTVLYEKKTRL